MTNNSEFDTIAVFPKVQTNSYRISTLELIIYIFIVIIAVFGNTLISICLLKGQKLLRITADILILNLALCDIVFVLVSIPTTLAIDIHGYFPYGTIACKIINPLSTYTMNCIVFTLVLISLERFTTIAYSFKYKYGKKEKLRAVISIHVISLITVLPYIITADVIKKDNVYKCIETWSETSRRTYTIILFLLQFGIPLPVMIVLYSITWKVIQRQNMKTVLILDRLTKTYLAGYLGNKTVENIAISKKGMRKRKQWNNRNVVNNNKASTARLKQTKNTLKMFTGVVVVFAICMMPNQITWFYLTFKPSPLNHVLETVFYWLTYANAVLNPWIYGGLNPYIKKAYCQVVKKTVMYLPKSMRCSWKYYRNEKLQREADYNSSTGNTTGNGCRKRSLSEPILSDQMFKDNLGSSYSPNNVFNEEYLHVLSNEDLFMGKKRNKACVKKTTSASSISCDAGKRFENIRTELGKENLESLENMSETNC